MHEFQKVVAVSVFVFNRLKCIEDFQSNSRKSERIAKSFSNECKCICFQSFEAHNRVTHVLMLFSTHKSEPKRLKTNDVGSVPENVWCVF